MKKIIKTVTEESPNGDLVINFSDEEMAMLGMREGDVFKVEARDGEIVLTRMETVSINLNEFSYEELQNMICSMADNNMTPHEYVEAALVNVLKLEEDGLLPKPEPDYADDYTNNLFSDISPANNNEVEPIQIVSELLRLFSPVTTEFNESAKLTNRL